MKGRTEHELRIKRAINNLLNEMPNYVSDYYFTMQVSKEPTTCLEYLRKIKHFLEFVGTDLEKVSGTEIGKYFEYINYTNNNGELKKTSFAYKQMVWSVLNQFFNYLIKSKKVSENPMNMIDRPSKKDNVKRKFLSLDELNSILKAVNIGVGSHKAIAKQKEWKERDSLIMFLFMNTGMRKTALSEINVEDISFTDKELIVTDKRNKTQIYNITSEMEKITNQWLNKREKLLAGKKSDALFISSRRERMSEKSIYNLVRKYSEEALGYAISPHKLRAAFVSLYYEASGGDIKATCEAVGHADISTTSIYITRRNNSRKEAQNFMSKSLKI